MSGRALSSQQAFTARRKRHRFVVGVSLLGLIVTVWLILSTIFSAGSSTTVPLASGEPTAIRQSHSAVLPEQHLVIHLVGEVRKPGLYALFEGARVVDAVLRAGGLTSLADQCGINLARAVADGEQVVVPRRVSAHPVCALSGSPASAGSVGSASGGSPASKISLSRASAAELDTLPGVGPALAGRIIDWRTAHGGFSSVKQLDEVSGIGPRLLQQLTPLVTP